MIKREDFNAYFKEAEQKEGKRIYKFLVMQEEDSVYDFSEDSPYGESILSKEVKKYFTEIAMQAQAECIPEKREEDVVLEQVFSDFELDDFEKMCMELVILGEINPYFEKFFIYMNNDWNQGYLTIDTAICLYTLEKEVDFNYYRYFLDEGKLLKYFLTYYEQQGKGRVRWGLKCRNRFFQFLFSEKSSLLTEFGFLQWQEEQQDLLYESSKLFCHLDVITKQENCVVYLYGAQESETLRIVREYSKKYGHDVCMLNIGKLESMLEKNRFTESLRELCYDIILQAVVKRAWICLYFVEKEFLEKKTSVHLLVQLIEILSREKLSFFITGEQPLQLAENNPIIWEVAIENEESDVFVWKKLAERYVVEDREEVELFSNTYHFNPEQVERIFQNAEKRRILAGRDLILKDDIKKSCIQETGDSGNAQITVMDTGYKWEDLVLPDRQKEQLKAACNRIRYKHQVYHNWGFVGKFPYGRGVSMVFSGPPGTGKTMSAGVVADYLGTTLYRVDLAAVVSKYIGETEKNLNAVFEAVKKGQGVLFFDEADVLFSKRTEVQNSNDKHSNMEVAYLLQKMESYEGVVILATNYIQNMDEAFKRRIPFLIEFPFPDIECRRRLWEKAFPKQMEFEETPNYDFLAEQFELSGSHIKNIAVQAAFFAAEEKKGVNMRHIMKALMEEVRKTGKRISPDELREYSIYFENI